MLGAMLLSPDAVDMVIGTVEAADFYTPSHGHIFDAIASLSGGDVDPVTVADALRREGRLADAGGEANLVSLQADCPSVTNAASYGRIVRDLARQRRLHAAAARVAATALEPTSDVDALLDGAVRDVSVAAEEAGDDGPLLLSSLVEPHHEVLRARGRGEEVDGPTTGWRDLDELVVGLRPGALVTIAARPSIGKTAVLLALAASLAHRDHPTLAVSLEMSRTEVMDRILAADAGVKMDALQRGRLPSQDKDRVIAALGGLAGRPLAVVDRPALPLTALRSACRRARRDLGGLSVVVVDYLQLMVAPQRRDGSRQQEVADVARGLKNMAGEMGCCVVAAAQLSRKTEERANKRPMLADLRESGEIENSSDVVVGLYRDDYYNARSDQAGILEMILLKQRQGPTGEVRVAYDTATGRIRDLTRR